MRFFIHPKPPFNFELITSLYARFPTQCVDLYHDRIYERVLKDKDKLFLIKVKSVGSIEKPKLQVTIFPAGASKKVIGDKIRWILGTDDEVTGFYKTASKDKRFTKIVEDLYGLRAPRTPTVFEALIIALTEQQIALPVAISLRKRLVEKYGESLKVRGEKYFAFPTAEALTKIRGLGPWTVEYMMCRGMGKYDALPAGDMGLRISLTKFLGKKERVSETNVREFLNRFGKHRGYTAFYLIYAYAFQKYPQERLL